MKRKDRNMKLDLDGSQKRMRDYYKLIEEREKSGNPMALGEMVEAHPAETLREMREKHFMHKLNIMMLFGGIEPPPRGADDKLSILLRSSLVRFATKQKEIQESDSKNKKGRMMREALPLLQSAGTIRRAIDNMDEELDSFVILYDDLWYPFVVCDGEQWHFEGYKQKKKAERRLKEIMKKVEEEATD